MPQQRQRKLGDNGDVTGICSHVAGVYFSRDLGLFPLPLTYRAHRPGPTSPPRPSADYWLSIDGVNARGQMLVGMANTDGKPLQYRKWLLTPK